MNGVFGREIISWRASFPAGGHSVYHIARPGEVTLTRGGSTTHYKMVAVHGEFVSFGAEGISARRIRVQGGASC
jgi:hypothetical protein